MPVQIVVYITPVVLFLVWLLVFFFMGKIRKKRDVSIPLSFLLMLYFFTVCGTGIFWVAKQELPVFDWHYLPGYILLLLGIIHVILHWKSLTSFFSKRKKAAEMPEKISQNKPLVFKKTGFILATIILSLVCFFIGKFTFKPDFSVIIEKVPEKAQTGLDTLPDNDSPIENKIISKYPLISPQYIRAKGVHFPLSVFYNQLSSYPAPFSLSGLTFKAKPPTVKGYDNMVHIPLPRDFPHGGTSVVQAHYSWIYLQKKFLESQISLQDISTLLYFTQGLNDPSGKLKRTAPSAGALYPVNLYVICHRVDGLKPGIYYYHPIEQSLVKIREGDYTSELSTFSGCPSLYEPAAVTVAFTVTFNRTSFKYQIRSYRYVNMDTGHAVFNFVLTAASLKWSSYIIGRFDDQKINRLLQLDPDEEGTLLLCPVGKENPDEDLPNLEPVFENASRGAVKLHGTLFQLIHQGTFLRRITGIAPFPPADSGRKLELEINTQVDSFKGDFTPVPFVLDAIVNRRSVRNYSQKPLDQNDLNRLKQAVGDFSISPVNFYSYSPEIKIYFVVRDVTGMEKGIYLFDGGAFDLKQIKVGDFSNQIEMACLRQEFCGEADLIVIKTVRVDDITYPDGDRGYRYANIKAGMIGEGLYLYGTAMNLGVCGVGAFYDKEIMQILGIDGSQEVPLYITAIGK